LKPGNIDLWQFKLQVKTFCSEVNWRLRVMTVNCLFAH